MTVEPDEAVRRRVDSIMDRGLALLDGGRPLAAWRAGRRLCGYRYSGGYELRGRALASLGKTKVGCLVMERGVKRVPSAWGLWEQIGILKSEMGQYDRALEAFDRSLAVEGILEIGYPLLNKAVVYQRLEQPKDALKTLDLIPAEELARKEALAAHVATVRQNAEDEIRPRSRLWRRLFFWRRR